MRQTILDKNRLTCKTNRAFWTPWNVTATDTLPPNMPDISPPAPKKAFRTVSPKRLLILDGLNSFVNRF